MLSVTRDNFFTRFFRELFPGRTDGRYNAHQTSQDAPGCAAASPADTIIVYDATNQQTAIIKADYSANCDTCQDASCRARNIEYARPRRGDALYVEPLRIPSGHKIASSNLSSTINADIRYTPQHIKVVTS